MIAHRIVLFVVIILLLVSCGPGQEEIAVTVESQVNAALADALTAVPTATFYPTQTAYPTQTPYPTSTPYPTYTPYPTSTPYPTFTPTATFTPEPTATATAVPAPTQESAANNETVAVPSGDLKSQLLALIDNTRADVELYSWTISVKLDGNSFEGVTGTGLNIDCQATVHLFDSIANISTVGANVSDPVMQNAYNQYVAAVNNFVQVTTPWTDGCREALVNGETHKLIVQSYSNQMRVDIDEQATNLLRQAINSLSE